MDFSIFLYQIDPCVVLQLNLHFFSINFFVGPCNVNLKTVRLCACTSCFYTIFSNIAEKANNNSTRLLNYLHAFISFLKCSFQCWVLSFYLFVTWELCVTYSFRNFLLHPYHSLLCPEAHTVLSETCLFFWVLSSPAYLSLYNYLCPILPLTEIRSSNSMIDWTRFLIISWPE